MSIDINWDKLTGGPDGEAFAENIRTFIHERFQQVTLPRFIRSVHVHAFEFGEVPPEIEIKDICDPLPDFYEDDESSEEEEGDDGASPPAYTEPTSTAGARASHSVKDRRRKTGDEKPSPSESKEDSMPTNRRSQALQLLPQRQPPLIDTRMPGLRGSVASVDQFAGPLLSRAPTPGIPGGTANMSYFHLPLSAGLSGTTTPLAAVAGAQFQRDWPDNGIQPRIGGLIDRQPHHHVHSTSASSITPPSSADPASRPPSSKQDVSRPNSMIEADDVSSDEEGQDGDRPKHMRERSVRDVQIVSRVRYSGNIKLVLTAEILLDYPMPSFVGIPLKLKITGLTFDGVAILAYIKKRAHFCFLAPDDADALVGGDVELDMTGDEQQPKPTQQSSRRPRIGNLLEELKVESEIGQKENGKQVLKNVGKVEKFVLDQVRRIFEDEFVYPSYWTFLV